MTIPARPDADFVLLPEVPFALDGEGGFLAHLHRRVAERGHATVVVAEGAGQELVGHAEGRDASGNARLQDIGPYLRRRRRNQVDPYGDLWMAVLESTGQPVRFR